MEDAELIVPREMQTVTVSMSEMTHFTCATYAMWSRSCSQIKDGYSDIVNLKFNSPFDGGAKMCFNYVNSEYLVKNCNNKSVIEKHKAASPTSVPVNRYFCGLSGTADPVDPV